jgi:hypothetical protein
VKRLSLAISFLLVAVAACSEPTTTAVNPKLAVVATHVDDDGNPLLDFGPVPVLLRRELVLVLENQSRAPLRIRTFELQDESGVFSLPDGFEAPTTIPGNESREVRVVFRPERQEAFSASILIESNDPRNDSVVVGLDGEGSTIGRVEIEPDTIDFGVVGEWTQAVENVRIASVGTAPLLVESIEILEGSSAAFAVLGSTKPTELPPPRDGNPGGEVIVQVACAPTDAIEENELSGTLRIRTTDPDRREVDIELRATVNRAPIAEFSIDPANHAPNLPIALDGTASYDPDGDEPLTFEWRVFDQPVGTTATFDDPTSPTPTLTVSQPGTYKIGLDVYDALGLPCRAPGGSELVPCKTQQLDIMAEDDLIVRLTWTHPITDLDLHLLEGNSELYSEWDCYWDNRNPDFGIPGDTGDDPRFTKESLKGFGPEEIVFSKPSGGSYTVAVEFAKTNGAADPTTEAVLEVYVFGKLEARMETTLSTPGQVWDVLSIDWPSAILTHIDEIREAVAR